MFSTTIARTRAGRYSKNFRTHNKHPYAPYWRLQPAPARTRQFFVPISVSGAVLLVFPINRHIQFMDRAQLHMTIGRQQATFLYPIGCPMIRKEVLRIAFPVLHNSRYYSRKMKTGGHGVRVGVHEAPWHRRGSTAASSKEGTLFKCCEDQAITLAA